MATNAERAERLDLIKKARETENPTLAAEYMEKANSMLELRKAQNIVAAKIAGLSWGKALDDTARRAIAEYGRRNKIDVLTEIDILGGRVYKNAEYYTNRAQPFIRKGVLELTHEFVNVDPRLDAIAKGDDPIAAEEARRIITHRAFLRIQHNIPENAKAAVVARLKFMKSGFI